MNPTGNVVVSLPTACDNHEVLAQHTGGTFVGLFCIDCGTLHHAEEELA